MFIIEYVLNSSKTIFKIVYSNDGTKFKMLLFRFGRIKGMMGMLVLVIVFGTFSAFAQNYVSFLVGICGCGFATIGYGTIMYCWMMELLAGNVKTVFGCMPQVQAQNMFASEPY